MSKLKEMTDSELFTTAHKLNQDRALELIPDERGNIDYVKVYKITDALSPICKEWRKRVGNGLKLELFSKRDGRPWVQR